MLQISRCLLGHFEMASVCMRTTCNLGHLFTGRFCWWKQLGLHLVHKYLPNGFSVLGTVLGIEDTASNKIEKIHTFTQLTL